jgi:hypothetical protein
MQIISVSSTNTDYVGTQGNRIQGTTILDTLVSLYGTFTGFHRCFTDDELYNNNGPNKFKDDYVGRIVISNGKISTDISNDQNEWNIFYDKNGITPEDAVPIIHLSRTKKDTHKTRKQLPQIEDAYERQQIINETVKNEQAKQLISQMEPHSDIAIRPKEA